MNASRLLEHFDRISEAPDAIPKLRKFILDIAVQGKLVEQDESEPAITNPTKANAPKRRNADDATAIEPPFEIPANWRWSRLIDLTTKLTDGTHHSPTNSPTGDFKYITAKNIKPDGISLDDVSYVSANVHRDIYTRCNPEAGDVLYIKDGATTGVVTINDLTEPFSMLSSVALIKLVGGVYNRLFVYFLRSPFFYDQMRGFMKGAAIPRVTLKRMAPALIPLPPLAEQRRIVAKVDELMGLCDRLEAARGERETRRDKLVASTTGRMSEGADTFGADDWKGLFVKTIPRLSTEPRHLEPLKNAIVGLAVRGQLFPQVPSDESASRLLDQIRAAKRTAGERQAKQQQAPVDLDELPFEIQAGWKAVRIGEILLELQTGPFGSSLHQSDYEPNGIPVVNPASIQDGRIVPIDRMAVSQKTLERLSTFKLRAGDIVMARRGEMGRCAVVTHREDGWLCGTGSLILRLPFGIYPQFLALLIGSPFVRRYLGGAAVGTTMQNLNQSILLDLVVGLPGNAEQQRIVAKVSELMALCDRLEEQLASRQETNGRLLDAVLGEALVA